MAAITTDIDIQPAPRNTRLNEIIAIGMIALALLLGLCLASYNPNDPSWNAAGESATHNWIGAVGANVAAALFQTIGVVAYLLPLLLLATAWRRFRSRRINAALSRVAGLLLLVLSASALLTLARIRPFIDASFNAGGLAGAVIARGLAGWLNTIGATILLAAIAATGILLATNFSFAQFYERLTVAVGTRLAGLRSIPERFRAWRHIRRTARQQRREMRRLAKTEPVHASDLKAAGVEVAGVQTEAGATEIRSVD